MNERTLTADVVVALPKPHLDDLLAALRQRGYQTHGPRLRDGVVSYGPIEGLKDLPRGVVVHQDAGRYRVEQTDHPLYFAATPGADSWKRYLFPPRRELFHFRQRNGRWETVAPAPEATRYALIGVRPCELAAMAVQDAVFLREDFTDPHYHAVRERLFIVAVNCLHPGDTCFCASLGTGPEASSGYDLLLTELDDVFLVAVGSEAGREVLQPLPWEPATAFWLSQAQRGLEHARQAMGRHLPDPESLPETLLSNLNHPAWDEVASRCLSCANCTQVCPTCFCWDVQDEIALDGETVTRFRVWDSCFSPQLSYLAGGNARPTVRARYRQWVTHKFASWVRQFGTLGCVGCGRCITWCPAGIDITETLAAVRNTPQPAGGES